MKQDISHEGSIIEISDKLIKVQIISQSACSSCRAKGMCSAFEMSEKVIEVKNDHKPLLKTGDRVDLVMTRSMGSKAVILGYFLPFLLVLVTLLVLSAFLNELWAGLLSLSALVPYYIILSLYKDRLSRTFEFKIEPAGRVDSDCHC